MNKEREISGYEYQSAAKDSIDAIQRELKSKTLADLPGYVENLTAGILFEKQNDPKEKPCLDFAVETLPELKRRAKESIDTQAGRMLLAQVMLSECALPSGATLKTLPPLIDGSEFFQAAVMAVFNKLPYSAQEKITNVLFVQFDPKKTLGIVNLPGARVVSIAPHLTGNRLKKVIAHEAAHICLFHKQSNPQNEAEADAQATKWGF